MTWMPNKNRLRLRAGTALFLCALLVHVSGCSVTIGGKKRPLLQYEKIHGEISLEAERYVDKQKTIDDDRKNKTINFREEINFHTEGSIYHPNLMTFTAGLGLGLVQSEFEFDNESSQDNGTISEYDFTGNILPKKPYPVSFNLRKSESFVPRIFTSSLRTETKNTGIRLVLRETDWPMSFSYTTLEIDQSGLNNEPIDAFSQKDNKFRYLLSHAFSANSKFRFKFTKQDVDQKRFFSDISRTENEYDLRHKLTFGKKNLSNLNSSLVYSDQSGFLELDRLRWTESLKLWHSDTLTTQHRFNYLDTSRGETTQTQYFFSTGFTHYLYESLITNGDLYFANETFNSTTKIDRLGVMLNFDYNKYNRWGQFFASYNVNSLKLEQQGGGEGVSVVDEEHVYTTLGSQTFELVRRNVDPTTIDIEGIRIYFEGFGADYTVRQVDGVTFIDVVATGAIFSDGGQTLLVDYDYIIEPERTEESITQNFVIRQRFNNGLSLYYTHSRRDEDIDSTGTDILQDEFNINTYGLDYYNRGFRLAAEYMDKKSTILPYTSKRLQAEYGWRLNSATIANIYVSQNWSDFTGTVPHEVTTFVAGASITSKLTNKYSLSSSINYHKTDDTFLNSSNPEGYKLDTHLKYKFRQLRFLAGAEYSTLKATSHKTDRTLVYMKVKRLF